MSPEEPVPELAADLRRCLGWPAGSSGEESVFARALAFVLWREQGAVAAVYPGADAVFRQRVFPFLRSDDAVMLRHRFGTLGSLCAEGADELAAALLEQERDAPASDRFLTLTAGPLAAAIASAWSSLDGKSGRPAAIDLAPMDHLLISALLLGTAVVAALLTLWQKLGASKEFCELARLHGDEPWARVLMRQPELADRIKWTLRVAWDAAARRRKLSYEQTAAAIHALSGLPDGRRLSCEAGEPFDPLTMQSGGGNAGLRFVAAVLRDGLEWKGQVLARAEVDAGTADYVAVTRGADGSDREKLFAAAGGDPANLRLTKAVFHDALDRIRDPAERDRWLRRLTEHWPGGEVRLIVPRPGEDFDDWAMTSTDRLSAPRLALVAERQHCGLRRTDGSGEVLVRALVTTRLRPEAARRI